MTEQEIYNGAILIAKQKCTMSNGEDALIIGKEYVVENVSNIDFTIKSEVTKHHYFSLANYIGINHWQDFFDLKTQTTSTNMDFIPNFKQNKQPSIFSAVVFLLAFWGLISVFRDFSSCNQNTTTPPQTDSTAYYKLAKIQYGKEAAIFMNEAARLQNDKLILLARLDSSKAKINNLTNTNYTLIKKLRQNAPKECEVVIDSVSDLYNEIIVSKDSLYSDLFTVFLKADSSYVAEHSANEMLQSQVKVADKIITADSLTKVELSMQLIKADKKARRAKIFNKALLTVGLIYTGVVMYLTIVR